ncbi:hypothetical protein [Pseudomonas synxantha]|uniref:hypothetical protein n=1 Tax=Pseudomonas synxantha TaxID=47883 RepID=UPI000F568347|nr:hypothetical protein [Pseudomonas synxantha]
MCSSNSVCFIGFHGTSLARAAAILAHGYHYVSSKEDWLGSGVYFFMDGFSCAKANAVEWASNKYLGEEFAVVKSVVELDSSRVLDLTSMQGLAIYNNTRLDILDRYGEALKCRRDISIKKRKDIRLDDKIITDLVLKELEVDVLVHNVYIKNRQQRELALESSYPNATVFSVSNLSFIRGAEIVCL